MTRRLAVLGLLFGACACAEAANTLQGETAVLKLTEHGVIRAGDHQTPEQALRVLRDASASASSVPADAGVVWGYLGFENQSEIRRWTLLSTNHLYQSITVYAVEGGGPPRRLEAMQPAWDFSSLLVLPLVLQPNGRTELLVRMQASMMHSPYLRLQTERASRSFVARFVIVSLLCIGALLALLVYNGFLAIALRSGLYAVYCLYLLAHGAFMLLASGLLLWLFPALPLALSQTRPWALLSGMAMVWFAWRFLGRAAIPRWLRGVLLVQLLAMLILAVLSVISPTSTGATAGIYTAIFMTTLLSIIVAGAVASRAGNRSVGIFLLAWTVLVASYVYAGVTLSFDSWRTVWTNIAPLLGGTVEMLLLSLALAQSIGQARSRADTLEMESAQKTAFIGTLTHEIRTPLHAVLATMEAADAAARTTPAQLAVTRGRAACESLYDLVDGLVDHASLSVSPRPHNVPFRLRALIDGVVLLFEWRADQAGMQIDCSRVEDLTVNGPAVVARRVLINLLSNAVKYAGAGQVIVTASVIDHAGSDWLRITVADEGPGMPAGHTAPSGHAGEHNLAALYAGNPSSGLGLPMTQALLGEVGGQISIDSVEGEGTRVTVLLPVSHHRIAPQPLAAGVAARSLWLADDDAATREVMQRLPIAGVSQLSCFATADDLLSALGHTNDWPAAVMVDLRLGDTSGLHVLDRVREHAVPGVRALPCILTSANIDANAAEHAHARVAVVLQKPFDSKAVAAAMRDSAALMQAWQQLLLTREALGADQMAEAARLFVEQAHEDLQRVTAAREPATRQSAAHRLLSAASALGLHDLATAARAVEQALDSGSGAGDVAELSAAVSAATRACKALQAGRGEAGNASVR